jgi:bifunctional enzyme CysN/CysC
MLDTDLLRFVTAGSVDDGKSTLIGRLLYDTKQVLVDQLEHVEEALAPRGHDYVDLALLTDGLRAEREQGITIDVAYRYFVTPRGASSSPTAPGPRAVHAQHGHGRLDRRPGGRPVDARKGVVEQTRRHAFISSLLGIPHVVCRVNKMDLVDFSEERFDEIAREFAELRAKLEMPRRDRASRSRR